MQLVSKFLSTAGELNTG